MRKGDFEIARGFFKRAIKADPLCGRSLLALGDIASQLNKYSEALGYFRSARTLRKFEEAALRAEVSLLLQTSRLDEALETLEVLNRKYPKKAWRDLIGQITIRLHNR